MVLCKHGAIPSFIFYMFISSGNPPFPLLRISYLLIRRHGLRGLIFALVCYNSLLSSLLLRFSRFGQWEPSNPILCPLNISPSVFEQFRFLQYLNFENKIISYSVSYNNLQWKRI